MNGANTTVTTYRMETVSGKQSYSSTPTITSEEAYIEPLSEQAAANYSGENQHMLFLMVMDGIQDVISSDKVVDGDGFEYIVKGIKPYRGGEIPSHTEAVILKTRQVP